MNFEVGGPYFSGVGGGIISKNRALLILETERISYPVSGLFSILYTGSGLILNV